jgi:hypothetical protein
MLGTGGGPIWSLLTSELTLMAEHITGQTLAL